MKKPKVLILIFTGMLMLFSFSCKEATVEEAGDTLVFRVDGQAVGFIEKDSLGNDFNLESLKGNVILLTFSAMWCGPCRREASELVEINNVYSSRGVVIVQCLFEDENGNPADLSDLKRWIDEFEINFTVINDPDRSTVNLVNISQGIPFNIVIDRNFVVQYRRAGFSASEIVNAIEGAL